jgi:diphosphomevalonate decarboxylase
MSPPLPAAGRATAVAPANIAFVKYWGATDLERALPANPSISMTLSRCVSRTTVEFDPAAGDDEVLLRVRDGEPPVDPGDSFKRRVLAHLEALRHRFGLPAGAGRFRVETANTFPAAAGIASSASGFAALATATAAALGRSPDPRELSCLARLSGSGSATRSAIGGYVEWPAPGSDPEDPPAVQLAPATHWDLRDLVAVVRAAPKDVPSLAGHRLAPTSAHFERRQQELPRRLAEVRAAIAERDLARLGTTVEEEAIELHVIAMTSRPPIHYWSPATIAVLAAVRELREEGVQAWSTMDAGANVHVITDVANEVAVAGRLRQVEGVEDLILDKVGDGPFVEPAR